MLTFLLTLHFVVTVSLVGSILIQKSEGGGWGMGGSSGGVLSPRGQANLLTHVTAVLAGIFIVNCLVMGAMIRYQNKKESIVDAPVPVTKSGVESNSRLTGSEQQKTTKSK